MTCILYIAISVDFTRHGGGDLASPRRQDRRNGQTITCKFWNDTVETLTFNVGDHVLVKNVDVDIFRDTLSVSATDETQAEVCDFNDF